MDDVDWVEKFNNIEVDGVGMKGLRTGHDIRGVFKLPWLFYVFCGLCFSKHCLIF